MEALLAAPSNSGQSVRMAPMEIRASPFSSLGLTVVPGDTGYMSRDLHVGNDITTTQHLPTTLSDTPNAIQ